MTCRWLRTTLAGAVAVLWAVSALAQTPVWNVEVEPGGTAAPSNSRSRQSGGVSFGLGHSAAAFLAEVRYHYAHMNPTRTSIVPITFGIRLAGNQ
jgi:hypothetical protein